MSKSEEKLANKIIRVLETELIVRDYFYNRDGHNVKVISHLFEITKYSGEMKKLLGFKRAVKILA
jgi:hypothetical protein